MAKPLKMREISVLSYHNNLKFVQLYRSCSEMDYKHDEGLEHYPTKPNTVLDIQFILMLGIKRSLNYLQHFQFLNKLLKKLGEKIQLRTFPIKRSGDQCITYLHSSSKIFS